MSVPLFSSLMHTQPHFCDRLVRTRLLGLRNIPSLDREGCIYILETLRCARVCGQIRIPPCLHQFDTMKVWLRFCPFSKCSASPAGKIPASQCRARYRYYCDLIVLSVMSHMHYKIFIDVYLRMVSREGSRGSI
jgi:hypothetical protein